MDYYYQLAAAAVVTVIVSVLFGYHLRGAYELSNTRRTSLLVNIATLFKDNKYLKNCLNETLEDNKELRLQVVNEVKRGKLLEEANEQMYQEGFKDGFQKGEANAIQKYLSPGLTYVNEKGRIVQQ